MKTLNKLVSLTLLISMLLLSIWQANSYDWKYPNWPYSHKLTPVENVKKPMTFWIFAWNAKKTEQNCTYWTSFRVLDSHGKVIKEYSPENCEGYNDSYSLPWTPKKPVNNSTSSDTEIDSLLNDIFGSSSDFNETRANVLEEVITEKEPAEDSSSEDIDAMLKSLFGQTDDSLNISSKDYKTALSNFFFNKAEVQVGSLEVKGIANDENYNSWIAKFASKIDNEFQIQSIKEDFIKHLDKVAFSYYSYNSLNSSSFTKEVFKTKLVSDLKNLATKYEILKKKDRIISKM